MLYKDFQNIVSKEAMIMINWILGGFIISLVLFIMVKNIRGLHKGESPCSGCSLQETPNCSCVYSDTE